MSDIWLEQQHFAKSYGGWIDALKGQQLDRIFVFDPDPYCDSPDYDYEIPCYLNDDGIVLELASGRTFHAIFSYGDIIKLLEDGTDVTKTIRVEEYPGFDDEVVLIDKPLWQPLDDYHDTVIIDIAPSFDCNDQVNGVVLIFPGGNLCIKNDGFFDVDVKSPRYIERIKFREMYELMSSRLLQFGGYLSDLESHSKGRNPDEEYVFDKLACREDISALFGRYKLGFSNNCLPSHNEACGILVELTMIIGAVAPEKVFDTFNWFCREYCNETAKCEDCAISAYCNRGLSRQRGLQTGLSFSDQGVEHG